MIKTLFELNSSVEAYISSATTLLELKNILMQYKGNDWEQHMQFSETGYTRTLLHRHALYEILLLCWLPQQKTPLHDHPYHGCLLRVLKGSLLEERYSMNTLEILESQTLSEGSIGFIENAEGIHRVSNVNSGPTVSLHIYAPPEYQYNCY